jgi:putative tryptophan/tyrosine transport system substrate-binding protein
MRRRDFVTFVGSFAAEWPFAARAQHPNAVRVIGVLTGGSGPDSTARLEVLLRALAQLGWTENHKCSARHPSGRRRYRRHPQVRGGISSAHARCNRNHWGSGHGGVDTVPIVFTIVPDPVASGFVASLSRPGGNATGFLQFEYRLSSKWLELLKQIAPNVTRAAVLRDSAAAGGIGQFASIQSAAPSLGVEVTPVDVENGDEIERDVTEFARSSNSGLVVTSSTNALVNRKLIVSLAARLKLPAVYAQREFVAGGGLISYSADFFAQFRAAASYVDRILKGEKPANLPVQAPTKYDLVINLKTANELGLISVPQHLLVAADEVIE